MWLEGVKGGAAQEAGRSKPLRVEWALVRGVDLIPRVVRSHWGMPPHDTRLNEVPSDCCGQRARAEALLPVGRRCTLRDGDFPGESGLSGEGEN